MFLLRWGNQTSYVFVLRVQRFMFFGLQPWLAWPLRSMASPLPPLNLPFSFFVYFLLHWDLVSSFMYRGVSRLGSGDLFLLSCLFLSILLLGLPGFSPVLGSADLVCLLRRISCTQRIRRTKGEFVQDKRDRYTAAHTLSFLSIFNFLSILVFSPPVNLLELLIFVVFMWLEAYCGCIHVYLIAFTLTSGRIHPNQYNPAGWYL